MSNEKKLKKKQRKKKNVGRGLPGVLIGEFTMRFLQAAPDPATIRGRGTTWNLPFDAKTTVLTDKPVTRPKRTRPLDS